MRRGQTLAKAAFVPVEGPTGSAVNTQPPRTRHDSARLQTAKSRWFAAVELRPASRAEVQAFLGRPGPVPHPICVEGLV